MVRNPFDILATTYIYYSGGPELRLSLKNNPTLTIPAEEAALDCLVERHVEEVASLKSMHNAPQFNIHKVYSEDMVLNPKEEIIKLCKFLELECSQDYIDNCVAAIFPSSSKSRYRVQWTQKQIDRVIELINTTTFLRDKYPPVF